eukprot:Amastigsp_a5174_68.p1 type:complete len:244 gc:universal Amastigsp_a5174_68:156-887(+)
MSWALRGLIPCAVPLRSPEALSLLHDLLLRLPLALRVPVLTPSGFKTSNPRASDWPSCVSSRPWSPHRGLGDHSSLELVPLTAVQVKGCGGASLTRQGFQKAIRQRNKAGDEAATPKPASRREKPLRVPCLDRGLCSTRDGDQLNHASAAPAERTRARYLALLQPLQPYRGCPTLARWRSGSGGWSRAANHWQARANTPADVVRLCFRSFRDRCHPPLVAVSRPVSHAPLLRRNVLLRRTLEV